jgi:1-acyl-sn-glycerol-3-phosphate acyltransferase
MVLAIGIVKPLSVLLTKRAWHGQHRIPRTGGVIIAANHLSWIDPFTLAHFVYAAGRIPRFMAKESLFRVPVTGWILRGADQIPVHRGARDGSDALRDAVLALRNGEAVLIYPEGTITRDPECWPMQAKTGVARLALLSGAPIVPVAQWGAQEILGASKRIRLLPRRTIRIRAGEPISPEAFARFTEDGAAAEQPSRAALRALTAEVMQRIRVELAAIRGETPPAAIWDPVLEKRVGAQPDAPPGGDAPERDEGAA